MRAVRNAVRNGWRGEIVVAGGLYKGPGAVQVASPGEAARFGATHAVAWQHPAGRNPVQPGAIIEAAGSRLRVKAVQLGGRPLRATIAWCERVP